jgi:hypothetical protein
VPVLPALSLDSAQELTGLTGSSVRVVRRHPSSLLRRFGACLGRMDLGPHHRRHRPFRGAPTIPALARDLPGSAACDSRVVIACTALKDYTHEHAVRDLTWDLANASRAREVCAHKTRSATPLALALHNHVPAARALSTTNLATDPRRASLRATDSRDCV